MRRPLIIDTDPGIDDSIAILMILGCDEIDVRAITTVAGNKSIEQVTANALKIIDASGKGTTVAIGAKGPLKRTLKTADWVHGETGIGTVVLPTSEKEAHNSGAVDIIYKEALRCEGNLEILAIGPLTNIAMTIQRYPNIKALIKQITIMGGSVEGGNITNYAEFNIYVDPEAAKTVFESGIPITMVGLEATHKAIIHSHEINSLKLINNRQSIIIHELMTNLHEFCEKINHRGAILHDPLAAACIINKDLLKFQDYNIMIETEEDAFRGQTKVIDSSNNNPIEVAVDVDREEFIRLIKELLSNYS